MTPSKPPSLGEQPAGATPLDADSLEGLRLSWVSTQADLNEAEAANILTARGWAFRRRAARLWVLDPAALRELHRRMLADVWKWAGTFRLRETMIGIDPYRIPVATRDLCDDINAQLGDGTRTAYPLDEIAGRFHHRLVQIHPFPNGNGRHSRLATDLLVRDLGLAPFTWGGTGDDMVTATDTRRAYIAALRAADGGDIVPLLKFVRSESVG
jgi:Fic-DOC domain mobile mystery protein B